MRFVLLIVGLMIFIGILCFAVKGRVLGHKDEVPSHLQMLLPSNACTAPCWQGIQPNKTFFDNVPDWWNELPRAENDPNSKQFSPDGHHTYLVRMFRDYSSDKVSQVNLRAKDAMYVGDIFRLLGMPDCVNVATQPTLRLSLSYNDEYMRFSTGNISQHTSLSPRTSLEIVIYHKDEPSACLGWYGFAQLSHYIGR